MRKWLVGLMAAGLCAASAWAESYTLVTSMEKFGAGNYVITGEKAEGEEHAMLNQVASGNFINHKTDAEDIVEGVISNPDASIIWTVAETEGGWTIYNESAGGYVNYPGGKNNAATEKTITTNSTWTIAVAEDGSATVVNVGTPARVLQYNASASRFACYLSTMKSLKFYKEGSLEFTVEVEPSEEFRKEAEEWVLTEGTSGATLTAVAKHGEGEISYAWSGAFEGSNATLPIPDGLSVDDTPVGYSVTVTATDSSEPPQTATAEFSFTLVRAPQAYTVTVADGIENGSVEVYDGETKLESSAEVLEGTTLKVVAIPATRSYKVESVTVTGETSGEIALENGEFAMPAENVSVTATFVERTQTAYSLVESMDEFEAGADYLIVAHKDGSYTSALKNAYQSESDGRIALEEVEIGGDNTVETEEDSIVWTIAAGSEGKYTLYNAAAAKFVSAPASSNLNSALLVDAKSDAAQWTIAIAEDTSLATIGSIYEGKSLQRNDKANNAYFANYKGGTKPYLFKKVGAGVFSISLDPAADFEVPEGTEATITASAKNAQGEVTYEWSVTQDDTPGSAEGNVWTIPADAAPGGPWTVYCSATDGTSEADASVSFSIEAAPAVYEVTVEQDLEGGRVDVDPTSGVAGTIITVTATAEDGYRCDGITVNGEPLTGSTFELPEGGAVVSATFVESPTKTATYTVASKSTVDTTGVVPEGSEATFECNGYSATQLTGGTHMTLTLNGYEGAKITGLTLSMKSNGRSGAGSLSVTCGDAILAAISNAPFSDNSWNGAYSSEYVDIKVPVAATIDDDVVITIDATANSLYCQSFTVAYEPGTPAFSVALDPAEAFTVVEGEAFSIEATPKNAVGEVSYAWTVDGVAAETDGNLLSLTAGEASETAHEVVCVATDGGAEGVTAEASVSYTVIAAPAMFAVTVAEVENGTVALSVDGEPLETPAEVAEGTEVTVSATPADGYALEAITVNGTALEGTTTFTVTADAKVSATFAEVVDYATLPFLAEGTPFTGPWQNPREAGVTADGLDTDYNSETEGRGAKFKTEGSWLQIKFEGTPGELSYVLKGNTLSGEYAFDVQESATGAEDAWTPVASYPTDGELKQAKTGFTNDLSGDSRFVRFIYTTKANGNIGLYDVYISSSAFSVAVDKTGFELEEGTADTITAEAKNGTEPYTYAWTSETEVLNGEGAELAISATLAAGEYAATVTATDADGQTATADVAFTVVEPAEKFPVEIAIGILNGTVEADVDEAAAGDTVTVTATPAPGFKLGFITVSYASGDEVENLEFTTSPATFTMPATDVLVGATFLISNDEIFVPVESEAEFEAGGEYLIVARKDGSFTDALKNAAEGSRIGVDAVTIEADGYIKTDNADIVWKIQAGKEEGQYVLFNEAASVYAAATKNDNLAQLLEDGTNDLAQWTLDLSALPAVKIVSFSYTNRWLQRNTSTAYFATYTGTQTTPQLFKKVESLEFAVSVDQTGFELPLGESTIVTATAKFGVGDVTYVWTSETEELNGAGALLEIPATLPAGEYAATVTATDSSAEPQTATADVAFTVVAPAAKYPVTIDPEIANGTIAADKAEAEAGELVTLTATPADGWKLDTFLLNGVPFEGDSFEMPEGEALVSATFAEIVKHPVVIADGILNGTIEADKEEAAAGETVTLTATPADGYKLESISVNGTPIGGTSFEMPDDDALVTASFVERVMTTYERVDCATDFEAGAEYLIVAHKADSFTSAMKNEANGDRIGLDEVELKTETTIETDNDAIVWTIQAGAEGQYTLFNAAGVYAAAKSDGNYAQLVADGTDALAQWTLDLTALPEVKIKSASYPSRWLQRNGTANNKYFATYTGSQTTPMLFKKAGFSVGLDKEDGFTVEAGAADSITATALRGTEPYSYVWTGDLEGEGATLAIPADLAQGEYAVTVTATDSSEPALTASQSIAFTVVPPVVRFAITVAEGIVGGEVSVDKELAEAGETVTVTATPDAGYELVEITVNGTPIEEGNTFVVEGDSVVSATFNEIVDYATLPFVSENTPYSGPWYNVALPVGLTVSGIGSDYRDGSAKFDATGASMQIKFQGTPGTLSYGIKGNGTSETNNSVFAVFESADGETWTAVAVYETGEKTVEGSITLANAKLDEQYPLAEDTRFVKFSYETKGTGNVGIYDVYISEAGADEPEVTLVDGETTVELGDYFILVFALSNYADEFAWTSDVGEIDEDGYFTWTPTAAGEFPVVVSAVSGEDVIASASVTLTVTGEGPVHVPAAIKEMVFDSESGNVLLRFEGDGTAVYGTADLNGEWLPVEGAVVEGDTASVPMGVPFLRVQ